MSGFGELLTVFEEGDLLDGRVIADFDVEGFSNDQFVFNVDFEDGSKAVFLASVATAVPEPTTMIPAMLCFSSMVLRRQRSAS